MPCTVQGEWIGLHTFVRATKMVWVAQGCNTCPFTLSASTAAAVEPDPAVYTETGMYTHKCTSTVVTHTFLTYILYPCACIVISILQIAAETFHLVKTGRSNWEAVSAATGPILGLPCPLVWVCINTHFLILARRMAVPCTLSCSSSRTEVPNPSVRATESSFGHLAAILQHCRLSWALARPPYSDKTAVIEKADGSFVLGLRSGQVLQVAPGHHTEILLYSRHC